MNKIILLLSCLAVPVVFYGQNNKQVVKDIDGNIYQTIKIGDQVWMKENLRATHYQKGDPIETTEILNEVITDEDEPAYQWIYNGDPDIPEAYGRLYTWYAAAGDRQICPEGWHIPSQAEWAQMIEFLGGDEEAGGKIKVKGYEYWEEPNTGATNESGFSALPSGGRNEDGTFSGMGKYAAWWTSSPGMFRNIEYNEPYTFRYYFYRSPYLGLSVRCLKD